jgi:hypothetical protein
MIKQILSLPINTADPSFFYWKSNPTNK